MENNEATGKQVESVKRSKESNTVNRIHEGEENQPIRKRDQQNSRETSKSRCRTTACVRKMSQAPKLLRQKQIRKISEANHRNEVALDFAGPFRNAKRGEKVHGGLN